MATNPRFGGPPPLAPEYPPTGEHAVIPFSPERVSLKRESSVDETLQLYAVKIGRALGWVVNRTDQLSRQANVYGRRAYRQSADYSHKAYRQGTETARELSVKTRQQIAWVRREHPMEAIGIMCGVGVVAGVALRVWRSHKS